MVKRPKDFRGGVNFFFGGDKCPNYDMNNCDIHCPSNVQAKCKKPLFVQFVLDNVWAVYDAVVVTK